MQGNPLVAKVLSYLADDEAKNLHQQALTEIIEVFLKFLGEYENAVSWVTNAAPGHGKTTAMRLVLQFLADQRPKRNKIPVLVALRYKGDLDELEATLNAHRPDSCIAVHSDNVADNLLDAAKYQFVLITHARLKNLALNQHSFVQAFKWWSPVNDQGDTELLKHRMVIIDEMPDFVEGAIFDLGTNNNSVDWFDKLAKESGLSQDERIVARSSITYLVAQEFCDNPTPTNRSLKDVSPSMVDRLLGLLDRLPTTNVDKDAVNRLEWFRKILSEEGIARLYKENEGRKLLAARKVDYGKLGVPILVMDGTAEVTQSFYADFEFKTVTNHNNYSRLFLNWRHMKTHAEERQKPDHKVQKRIAKDIASLHEQGIFPFPITSKSDFDIYKQLNVITAEHQDVFNEDETTGSNIFHQRNLAGSNRLNTQTELYLTSLPILNPDAYRLMAFALFGSGVALERAQRPSESWFADASVETLYHEWFMAELVQLIHRSALRNITDNQTISVYMAHSLKWVNGRLAEILGIPEANLSVEVVYDPEFAGLDEKVAMFAARALRRLEQTWGEAVTVNSVSEDFNRLLENSSRNAPKLKAIDELLEQHGLQWYKNERNNRRMVTNTKTP